MELESTALARQGIKGPGVPHVGRVELWFIGISYMILILIFGWLLIGIAIPFAALLVAIHEFRAGTPFFNEKKEHTVAYLVFYFFFSFAVMLTSVGIFFALNSILEKR